MNIAMMRRSACAVSMLCLVGCAPGMMNPNPGEITADRAYYTGDHKRSAKLITPSAERGEPWAELRMGRALFEGRETEPDIPEALRWFKRVSAHHGDDAWSAGDMMSMGDAGFFNQNSDAMAGQYYVATILSSQKWGLLDLEQAYLYASRLLSESGGDTVYLCCIEIFENGLVLPGEEQTKLFEAIKAAMSPEQLARAEALAPGWSPPAG